MSHAFEHRMPTSSSPLLCRRAQQRRRLGRAAPPLRRVRQGADGGRRASTRWLPRARCPPGRSREGAEAEAQGRGRGGGGGCGAGGRGRRHKGGEAGRRGGAAPAKSGARRRPAGRAGAGGWRCRRRRRVRAAGQGVQAIRRGSLRRRRARLGGGGGELGRRVQLAEREGTLAAAAIAQQYIGRSHAIAQLPPTARRADERGSALEHPARRRARRRARPARRVRRAARRPGLPDRALDDPSRRAPPLA
jgi:hypothetical protein